MLHKRTLPHRSCLCVIHENIHLLLNALSNEINGLKTDLAEYTSKLVCHDTSESCMLSMCGICEGTFVQEIIGNILDKKKRISWSQWITSRSRTEKKDFEGRNKYSFYLLNALIQCCS